LFETPALSNSVAFRRCAQIFLLTYMHTAAFATALINGFIGNALRKTGRVSMIRCFLTASKGVLCALLRPAGDVIVSRNVGHSSDDNCDLQHFSMRQLTCRRVIRRCAVLLEMKTFIHVTGFNSQRLPPLWHRVTKSPQYLPR